MVSIIIAQKRFSWNLGNDKQSLIHHEGYYGVFGVIDDKDFSFEKYGVKITFSNSASVPCDRKGVYFWICIEGDFLYILDEEREPPIDFSQKIKSSQIISKLKSIFKKNNSHS